MTLCEPEAETGEVPHARDSRSPRSRKRQEGPFARAFRGSVALRHPDFRSGHQSSERHICVVSIQPLLLGLSHSSPRTRGSR